MKGNLFRIASWLAALGLLPALLAAAAGPLPPAPGHAPRANLPGTGTTTLVSMSSSGVLGDEASWNPTISAGGRYVAWESPASNLAGTDAGLWFDVFLHDRQTKETTLISVNTLGKPGNQHSTSPSISAGGRFVAFDSFATDLVAHPTNGKRHTFLRDRRAGETILISVDSVGVQANADSFGSSISDGGRYVAFCSHASNLVPGDSNGAYDVFVHDTRTAETTRVSVSSAGVQGNDGSCDPAISADGRYVTFVSSATNLVAGDGNLAPDVFVHDRQTKQTTRVSVDSGGVEGDDRSDDPSISADGRFVAFRSEAGNLVIHDGNHVADVFLHDRQAGQTTLVSRSSAGNQANRAATVPSISADGRHVAFQSEASNLVTGDGNNTFDVFVRDLQAGRTTLESVSSAGDQGYGSPGLSHSISGDGRHLVFQSGSSVLVPGGTNGLVQIFVRDRWATVYLPLAVR